MSFEPDLVVAGVKINDRQTGWINIEPALYDLYEKLRDTQGVILFRHLAEPDLNITTISSMGEPFAIRLSSERTHIVTTTVFDILRS